MPALAMMNSRVFDYIFKALLGRFSYPEFIVGVLQKLPWPIPTEDQKVSLASLATAAWRIARAPDTLRETSAAFVLPRALNRPGPAEDQMADIQTQIDTIALNVFGLDQSAAAEIDAATVFRTAEIETDGAERGEAEEEDEASTLISWAVGVAFGRFDIELATGQRQAPLIDDPFAAIHSISPGMLVPGAKPFHPVNGILVDDRGHSDDLAQIVSDVLHALRKSGDGALAPATIRRWLAANYFDFHLGMYSRSGRKAPIWWQFATPGTGYSIWLSYHHLTKDTLYRALNDYLRPKLALEESRLDNARRLERVVPLWDPDLDDGVLVNFAPLWRLVPQNRAWQKELRAAWIELCDGKLDWSHLAMRLWPERVVPKCAIDRSLAVAHGLEHVFWSEDDKGKWKPRKSPLRATEDLVSERTSSAVKGALRSLLEAPEPVSSSKRSRKAKAS